MKAYTTTFTVAVAPIVKSAKYLKTNSGNFTNESDIADVDGAVVNGSSADAKKENFKITFNKVMNQSSITNDANVKVFDKTANKYIAKTVITPADSNTAITFDIPNLETGHEYELTVGGMTALDGSAVAPQTFKFFYGIPQLMVGTAAANNRSYTIDQYGAVTPLLTNQTVYGYQTAYSGYSAFSFKAQFSQDVDAETVNDSNIVLKNKVTGDTVATTVTYEAGSRYAIVTPKEDLEEETAYELTIENVKTAKGLKTLEQKFAFTTGDYAAPTVVSVTPSNGEDNIALNKDIVINFSEGMDNASLTSYIVLKDLTENDGVNIIPTHYNASLSQDKKTYTLNNTQKLTVGHTYELTIKGDGISAGVRDDAAGSVNVLRSDYVVKFATVNATTTYLTNVKTGTYGSTGTELKDGMNSFDDTKRALYFTFDKALNDQAASAVQKIEKKSTSTNVWTDVTSEFAAKSYDNDNKTFVVTKSADWTKDTTYKVTLSGLKDENGNDVADQVFTFTVGTKPALNVAGSNPTAFSTTTKTNQQYLYAVIEDAESDLDVSTLNVANVKFVKKADQSAVPYTFVGAQYLRKDAEQAADLLVTIPQNEGETVASASVEANASGDVLTVTDNTKYRIGQRLKVVVDANEPVYTTVKDISTTGQKITLNNTYSVSSSVKIIPVDEFDVSTDVSKFSMGKLYKFGTQYAVVSDIKGNRIVLSNDIDVTGAGGLKVCEAQGVVYKLNADSKLESNEQYQLVISGVKDKAGNEIDATTKTFTTAKDVEKLSFVSATVADGDVSVPVNKEIVLTFNEDVDVEDVTLTSANDTLTKDTHYKVTKSGKTVTIKPLGFLKANTVYTITIGTSTASTEGTNITTAKTIQFQTEQNASVKPKIESAKYVDNGTTGVNAGDNIVLTLNAPTDLTSKVLGTAYNINIDGANMTSTEISNVNTKNDGYTLVLTIGTAPAGFIAGASKISLKDNSSEYLTDIMGNNFTTDAVIVEK